MAGIPIEEFDSYFRKAFQRLNADPIKDIATIAKVMKFEYKKAKLHELHSKR
jgi:hypothetical protein